MSCIPSSNGTTILIKNLPDDIVQDDLHDLFHMHGKITNKHLCIDPSSGNFDGLALVQFEVQDASDAAYLFANGRMYDGCTLNVQQTHFRWPQPESTLHITNLPVSITGRELSSLFDRYGPVIRASVPANLFSPQKTSGFGFVELRNPELARRALEEMNGFLYMTPDYYMSIQVRFAKMRGNTSTAWLVGSLCN